MPICILFSGRNDKEQGNQASGEGRDQGGKRIGDERLVSLSFLLSFPLLLSYSVFPFVLFMPTFHSILSSLAVLPSAPMIPSSPFQSERDVTVSIIDTLVSDVDRHLCNNLIPSLLLGGLL